MIVDIHVSLNMDSENPDSGQVKYTIPELGMEETFEYRLIPRSKLESLIRYEDGHVKIEEVKSQKLIKECGEFAFQACLDLIALPTFCLGDVEKRVAVEHDKLLNFMQRVFDAYKQPEETPSSERCKWFKQIRKPKTKKSELSRGVKCDASFLVSKFQQVGVGICTRNPVNVCWDCLAPI